MLTSIKNIISKTTNNISFGFRIVKRIIILLKIMLLHKSYFKILIRLMSKITANAITYIHNCVNKIIRLYHKLYVTITIKLSNPMIYMLTYLTLILIIRLIMIQHCLCEPKITVEYVKLSHPVPFNTNDYTKMDPMYASLEEQLNTKIDSNRKIVWHSDGTASLIYIKEDITTKFTHYEAYEYLERQKNLQYNTQLHNKPNPITINNNFPVSSELSTTQFRKYLFQYEKILGHCRDKKEVLTTSLIYWSEMIPPEMWAKTPEDLRNPKANINNLLDQLQNRVKFTTEEQFFTYIYVQATISTLNALHLNNMTLESHPAIAEKVFYTTVGKLLNASQHI